MKLLESRFQPTPIKQQLDTQSLTRVLLSCRKYDRPCSASICNESSQIHKKNHSLYKITYEKSDTTRLNPSPAVVPVTSAGIPAMITRWMYKMQYETELYVISRRYSPHDNAMAVFNPIKGSFLTETPVNTPWMYKAAIALKQNADK